MAHGYAPYEESALKAALRLAGAAAQGGAAGEGQSFIGGLGAGFGQSMKASDAARQAAMEYADKQEQRKRQAEKDALNQQFLEAEIEKMKRPAKPEPPKKDEEAIRILGRPLTEQEKQKLAGVYIAPKAPGKPGKGKAGPKPDKPRASLIKQLETIGKMDVNNPEHRIRLQALVKNPPNPEVQAAALQKLAVPNVPGAYRR